MPCPVSHTLTVLRIPLKITFAYPPRTPLSMPGTKYGYCLRDARYRDRIRYDSSRSLVLRSDTPYQSRSPVLRSYTVLPVWRSCSSTLQNMWPRSRSGRSVVPASYFVLIDDEGAGRRVEEVSKELSPEGVEGGAVREGACEGVGLASYPRAVQGEDGLGITFRHWPVSGRRAALPGDVSVRVEVHSELIECGPSGSCSRCHVSVDDRDSCSARWSGKAAGAGEREVGAPNAGEVEERIARDCEQDLLGQLVAVPEDCEEHATEDLCCSVY
eukprot:549580-Rhodomonas_salina.4